jgi:hypothetical protein
MTDPYAAREPSHPGDMSRLSRWGDHVALRQALSPRSYSSAATRSNC